MRVAVLGAGVIGKLRCSTVTSNDRTQLVGVMDVDVDRAKEAAGDSGAEVATDAVALIDSVDPDIVVVSSPVHFHEEQCLAALEAGAHVLCEKPLSNSLESCRRIRDAVRTHGRTFGVGFNHRFYPSVKYLVETLEAGRIGEIDHLRVFGGHDGLAGFRADWMFKGPLSGGGAMMDVGIHMTDLVNYVAGDVTEVAGIATGSIWNVEGSEDNAMVIMRTERDIPVLYHATWTEWKGYQIFLEAYGPKGMVRAAYAPMFNLLITQEEPGGARKRETKRYPEIIVREKLRGWETTTEGTFVDELDQFLRMIDGEPSRLADVDDGVRAIEIAQAVYTSTREHRTVTLPLP